MIKLQVSCKSIECNECPFYKVRINGSDLCETLGQMAKNKQIEIPIWYGRVRDW